MTDNLIHQRHPKTTSRDKAHVIPNKQYKICCGNNERHEENNDKHGPTMRLGHKNGIGGLDERWSTELTGLWCVLAKYSSHLQVQELVLDNLEFRTYEVQILSPDL
ncbi:hypothetical protein M8J75_000506 [Diaphorina citri]|nr:hypothetical protein M8J75_000506 [Diaphorina citri]